MPISTTCPKCEALFRLPDELAGRMVKCQKCAAVFVAPSACADTTMPGTPVAVEMEPALEEAQATSTSAAPLHGIGLPPMPTETPGVPARKDTDADLDRFSDGPRKAPPAAAKKADPDDRPPRSRRDEKPKVSASKVGVVLGILGFLLLAFVVCAGATGIWHLVAEKKKAAPIAKDGFRKKDVVKFGDVPNPDLNNGFNGPILSRPSFDGFKDGKAPEPPPPGPPGSIPVVFGPDGTFRDANNITLQDPVAEKGAVRRHKLYIVRLEAGYTYQFDMSSPNPFVLDPYLVLRDPNGESVADNDDILQGNQRDARLIYAPKESGVYRLEATYWDPETAPNRDPRQLIPPVGAYTLTVRHVK